jgi:hypothetical protein
MSLRRSMACATRSSGWTPDYRRAVIVLTPHEELAAARGYLLSPQQARILDRIVNCDYRCSPIELATLFEQGELDRETLCAALPGVWRNKLDDCRIPIELWREMFRAADFTTDGRRTRRPGWPVRLFRGATVENRAGLSWTTSLVQANYFAKYRQDPWGAPGQVWTTVAPPQYMLARYPKEGEGEYVVDACSLTLRPVDLSAPLTRLSARFPAIRPWG